MKRTAVGLFALFMCVVGMPAVARAACTVNWTGAGGDGLWQTATNWDVGVPASTDDACINAGTGVTLSAGAQAVNSLTSTQPVTISAGSLDIAAASSIAVLTLSGGTLSGTGDVSVIGTFTWTGGTIAGTGAFNANGGMTIRAGARKGLSGRTLNSAGAATLQGAIFGSGDLLLASGAVLNIAAGGSLTFQDDSTLTYGGGTFSTVNNAGTVRKTGGTGTSAIPNGITFNNSGTVGAQSGTLAFGPYNQTAGTTTLNGGSLTGGPFTINGGLLSGVGTITGSVTNAGGHVNTGASAGVLTLTGTYAQSAGGALDIKIGGTAASAFDQLAVSGQASLGGTLNITLINGFTPASGNTFTILTFGSHVSDFAVKNGLGLGAGLRFTPNLNPTDLTLSADPTSGPTITINPTTAAIPVSGTQSFTATSSDPSLTWSVQEGASGGTVNPTTGTSSTYTAPTSIGTFHVLVKSSADPTVSAVATVTVKPRVTIMPTTATVSSGGTQQFSATVVGTANMRVAWTVQEGSTGGTIDATGFYTAPAISGTRMFHVVATSDQDATSSATATVTVTGGQPTVLISPPRATLAPSGTQLFRASTAVNWSVQEAGGGTIDATGLYTAPATTGLFHVIAKSQADPTQLNSAPVVVGSSLPRFTYVATTDNTVTWYTIAANSGSVRPTGYIATGTNPVAVTASGGFTYVVNQDSGNISGYTSNGSTGALTPITGSPFDAGPTAQPQALAVVGAFAYVVDKAASLSPIYSVDPMSGALTQTGSFSAGMGPVALVPDATNAFLFVASSDGTASSLTIDPTSGNLTLVNTLPSGTSPSAIARHPSGNFVYVANRGSGTVSAYSFDGTAGTLTAIGSPINAGASPSALVIDQSGQFLYVANHDANSVSGFIIDPTTGLLTAMAGQPATTGTQPSAIAVDPSNQFVYVGNAGSNDVWTFSLDPLSGALTFASVTRARGGAASLAIVAGAAPVVLTPTFAYTADNGSNDISPFTIDPGTGLLTVGLSVPAPPDATGIRAVALDPLNRFAYTANATSNNVSGFTVDPSAGALTFVSPSAPLGTNQTTPVALGIELSGRFLFAASQGGTTTNVTAFRIDGTSGALTATNAVAAGTTPTALAIDPTGRFVYIANKDSNSVSQFTINPSTGQLTLAGTTLTGTGMSPSALTVSPTGRFLYVANQQAGTVSVFVIDATTGGLTGGATMAAGAAPSSLVVPPTEAFLYVANQNANNVSIFKIDPSTGALSGGGTPVPAGTGPQSITVDISGVYIYVAGNTSSDVSVFAIDPIAGGLTPVGTPTLTTGTGPTSVATMGTSQ